MTKKKPKETTIVPPFQPGEWVLTAWPNSNLISSTNPQKYMHYRRVRVSAVRYVKGGSSTGWLVKVDPPGKCNRCGADCERCYSAVDPHVELCASWFEKIMP